MAEFGTLNFAVAFKPTTGFPLDARYYFDSLTAAQAAAATAEEVGSSNTIYYYGENLVVVENGAAVLYVIQPDKTLKEVGSTPLGDGKSIEIADGKVQIKGFGAAVAGQQLRIGTNGAIEWFTPDTTTVEGLNTTVSGHTQDIASLQEEKADKATTLAGYGITDSMTAEEITAAILAAIAEAGHASFQVAPAVPSVDAVEDNVLYLVMNSATGHYDIYAKVTTETGSSVVLLDDTTVDLSAYATIAAMNTALAGKVDKVDGMGLSSNDYTDEDKAKLAGIEAGAQQNKIDDVSEEFVISEDKTLRIASITQDKVEGLSDALAAKVNAMEGMGLSSNDYTDADKEKLAGIESGAEANVIEAISINGTNLPVANKTVAMPIGGATPGVVKTSAEENEVSISADGSMSVNSLNVNKLVQTAGDRLVLDGGNSNF